MAKRTQKQIQGILGKIPQSFKEANPGISEGRLASRYQRTQGGKKNSGKSGKSGNKGLFSALPKGPIRDTASTQFDTNLATAGAEAEFNRLNESTPFGSKTYSIDPVTGRPVVSTEFNPFEGTKYMNETYLELERNKLAGEGGVLDQMRASLGQPLSYEGLTELPGQQDLLAYQKSQADALYGDWQRQNEHVFQKQLADFEQSMADRGISPGSEQYSRLYNDLQKAQNDARLSAQNQARLTGADLGNLAFTQAGQARTQGIGERTSLRDRPFVDTQGLLGLNRGYQLGQYSPTANVGVAPTDVAGIGLGYTGIASNEKIAQMNNAAQLQAANIGAAASRYGADAGVRAADIRNQGALDLQQNEFGNQPSPWQGVIGSIGQGVGSGLGNYFGNSLFGTPAKSDGTGGSKGLFGNLFNWSS